MIGEMAEMVTRLNLSAHKNLIGANFPEIVALLSIVFGGAFLLFGWKHHQYFLGVTGFLVGGWAGLMLKSHLVPSGGGITPVLYLATCSVAGAFVACCWARFMGILLGGFTVAVMGSVFLPTLFRPGDHALATVCMAFLLGGGLGAMFPKFFFIFNSSLIGSVFVTYGVSSAILGKVAASAAPETQVAIHLLLFLPLIIFGVLYQLHTSREVVVVQASPLQIPARGSL